MPQFKALFTPEQYKAQIRDIYLGLDENRIWKINFFKFRSALALLGVPLPNADITNLLKEKGDGWYIAQIPFEKVAFELIEKRTPEEMIRRAFEAFDLTDRGLILFEDLKQLWQEAEAYTSDEELQDLFYEFDIDCDGFLNFEEFAEMMTKYR